jgi:hypothetical protein
LWRAEVAPKVPPNRASNKIAGIQRRMEKDHSATRPASIDRSAVCVMSVYTVPES